MELGNRGDMKAGAAVTSLANGIASFGGIVEGPVVRTYDDGGDGDARGVSLHVT